MNTKNGKKLYWIGSSDKDLRKCSKIIKREFGLALRKAQQGSIAPGVKPLQGFGGAKVLEIITYDSNDTYRAVYTVKFDDVVFVLHVFKKKSKHGIATPKKEIDLVKERLKEAAAIYKSGNYE